LKVEHKRSGKEEGKTKSRGRTREKRSAPGQPLITSRLPVQKRGKKRERRGNTPSRGKKVAGFSNIFEK